MRTHAQGGAARALPPPRHPRQPRTTPAPAAPATGGTAGEGALPSAARYTARSISANAVSPAISADAIYCTTAQRFTADLHTPPVIALLTSTLRGGTRAGVQISLSKVSNVGLTIRRGGQRCVDEQSHLEHGKPRLLWLTPKNKPGAYSVTLTATDLAGNSASASGTVTVTSRVTGTSGTAHNG